MPATWNAALQAYDDGLGHMWRNETEGWLPIPGGSTGGGATAAPAPMGYAGIGSQLLNDQAQRDYWAGLLVNAQQQNANTASANQNQFNLGLAGLQQQGVAAQNAYNAAKAQFELAGQQATQLYNLEVAKLGVETARANYEQRLGDANIRLQQAQLGMQGAQFGLAQNQFNSQQKQGKFDRKYQITKDLADRRGPENIVGYMRLQNGVGIGDPRTTTVDPYAGLDELYQESNIQLPATPQIGNLAQPVSVTAPPPMTTPQFPGYSAPSGAMPTFVPPSGNLAAPTNTSQATPVQAPPPLAANPAMTGTNINGQGASSITTAAGTNPANAAAAAQGMQYMPDGTVRRIPGMNDGGSVGVGGMAIVGDSKSGKKTGNEELVHLTMDESGRPEMEIYPHEDIAHLLDERRGRQGGSVVNSKSLPPALMAMIPRAASGGRFGMGTNLGDPRNQATMGTGAVAAPPPVAAATPMKQTGGYLPDANQQRTDPAMADHSAAILSGEQAYSTRAQVAPVTPTQTNTIPFAPPPVAPPVTAAPPPLPGNPNAAGSYGADLNDQVYRFFDYGAEIGNQPFLTKLWGQTPNRPYGGFGASLSNPKLGISNAPTALNLRNYMDLSSTERTGVRNIYEQGLATNFDDFLEQSQRAAPRGMTLAGGRYGS